MSDHDWAQHHDPYHHDEHHDDPYDDAGVAEGHHDEVLGGLPDHDDAHPGDEQPVPGYEEHPGDDGGYGQPYEYQHHDLDTGAGDDVAPPHGPMGYVGADPDAVDPGETVSVFPAVVHVELPEPVDGFPWIDTGSLGLTHPVGDDPAGEQPQADPAGLAAYAHTDLPPGADPWAVLHASDDPATSALARWWSRPPETGAG